MKFRTLAVAGIATLALVSADPAGAHVRLRYRTNETVRLAVRVPVEAAEGEEEVNFDERYNEKVKLTFPKGFKLLSCTSNSDFRCRISGRDIRWDRRSSSDEVAEVDVFNFKIKTPKQEGNFDVAAKQTYADGDIVFWDEHTPAFGEPGYPTTPDHPALLIQTAKNN